MQKIPTLPKQSKVMARLKRLPVFLQIAIIILFLYLTWHFRYYTGGIAESELSKVEGVLYSISCEARQRGGDAIIFITSFPEHEVWLSGRQKCKFVSEAIKQLNVPTKVVYYIQRRKGFFSKHQEGTLYIYAVDLVEPSKPLIHPSAGLGVQYHPNPFSLTFFFMALALMEALRERWVDYRKKQPK